MTGYNIALFISGLMGGLYLAFPFAYVQLSKEHEQCLQQDNDPKEPDHG